jgi:hypothetical protein
MLQLLDLGAVLGEFGEGAWIARLSPDVNQVKLMWLEATLERQSVLDELLETEVPGLPLPGLRCFKDVAPSTAEERRHRRVLIGGGPLHRLVHRDWLRQL